MKTKPILLLLLFTIITFRASSQTTYGIRAGLNIANLDMGFSGLKVSTSSRIGMNLGTFVNFSLKENFSIQPELNFSQFGSKIEGVTETYNYLAIPVLGRFAINNLGFYAGPQLSFLTSSKTPWVNDNIDGEEDNSRIKSTEFSANLGMDYSLNNKIILSARYQFGLSNIYDYAPTEDDFFEDQKIKIRAFTLSVGYRF
jgi:opacity protein-like surface antigen